HEGGAVAITTSTGCGSGEFVGLTGIHLNNMLGEEDLVPVEHKLHAGDRLTSMMAPSLVLDGSTARPLLATGSAGSSRIRSAVLQTLLRALAARVDAGDELPARLRDAVGTARVHAEAGVVHAEAGYDEGALSSLAAAGHDVNRWPMKNLYFGG